MRTILEEADLLDWNRVVIAVPYHPGNSQYTSEATLLLVPLLYWQSLQNSGSMAQ